MTTNQQKLNNLFEMTNNQQKLNNLFEEFKDKRFKKAIKLIEESHSKKLDEKEALIWIDKVLSAELTFENRIKLHKEGKQEFDYLFMIMTEFTNQNL